MSEMPGPTQEQLDWRGEFSQDDCEAVYFTPDLLEPERRSAFANAAVTLTHKPSGISVTSQGAMDKEINHSRALAALKRRVENRR